MYFIFIALILLASYVALLAFESGRGERLLARQRARLDRAAQHGAFILAHVDFASFLREEARAAARRLTHDIAHFSLHLVRSVERLLARFVRHLRSTGSADPAPRETTRSFVRTLSEFKGHLEATRPEMPEVR